MKKAFLCLFLVCAALIAVPCAAQQGVMRGDGAPTSATNCAGSRFYIDSSTAILYVAGPGSPCTWSKAVDPQCKPDGSGNLTCVKLTTTAAEFSNGTCTTAKTIDPANGDRQKVTLTNAQACALTFTQPTAGTAIVRIKVIQSAVSSFNGTITGCKWPGASVPTITATTGAVDFITAYLDGTNAYCVANQDFR